MALTLRPPTAEDAGPCGEICYEAFATLAAGFGHPPDLPSPEVAAEILSGMIAHPHIYCVVAEEDGRVLGSNFMDERGDVVGIGPITVATSAQNGRVGRAMMQDVLDRAAARNVPAVRLVQAAYHTRSLALYAKLGFQAREMLSNLQGPALNLQIPGYSVRAAATDDMAACNALARLMHGRDRAGELRDAVDAGTARVVEHDGRIVGYTTVLAFFGHAVAESNAALKALIADAPEFGGPGFLLPTRNAELLDWCLQHGLRIVQQMTLMTIGLYNEPRGTYLPSILY